MNSLYQQMNQQLDVKNQIIGMLAQRNPMVADILKEVEENGGDAKALFYKKAREMGIDPQSILNQLR